MNVEIDRCDAKSQTKCHNTYVKSGLRGYQYGTSLFSGVSAFSLDVRVANEFLGTYKARKYMYCQLTLERGW